MSSSGTSYRTRFAPSPTGPLHLGHAFSALTAACRARRHGGEMLVRIEDLDSARCRPHWEDLIHRDLAWLGLSYPRPVLRQSTRQKAYAETLAALWARGLLYPCRCSRRDIATAASAPQEGSVASGPDGPVYPGTCRHVPTGAIPARGVLRLHIMKAVQLVGNMSFLETGAGPGGETGRICVARDFLTDKVGDVVLRRAASAAAYHLAVVVDDAHQRITEVVRGHDLFEATAIHVLLRALLDLPQPRYHHHALIRDETGKRLAKRDDARALETYRAAGWTAEDVRRSLGLTDQSPSCL